MVKVKFCGLTREEDIRAVNELHPDYIGFVFAKKSRRYVSPERAAALKALLDPGITAVGVFVDEDPCLIAELVSEGIIDIPQLHGSESDEYIHELEELIVEMKKKALRNGRSFDELNVGIAPMIQAFKIESIDDVRKASRSSADMILLDSGAGSGKEFDWSLLKEIKRPYFLAGGLSADNAAEAIERLRPYALDVSSGIETDGFKDKEKMTRFMERIGRK